MPVASPAQMELELYPENQLGNEKSQLGDEKSQLAERKLNQDWELIYFKEILLNNVKKISENGASAVINKCLQAEIFRKEKKDTYYFVNSRNAALY